MDGPFANGRTRLPSEAELLAVSGQEGLPGFVEDGLPFGRHVGVPRWRARIARRRRGGARYRCWRRPDRRRRDNGRAPIRRHAGRRYSLRWQGNGLSFYVTANSLPDPKSRVRRQALAASSRQTVQCHVGDQAGPGLLLPRQSTGHFMVVGPQPRVHAPMPYVGADALFPEQTIFLWGWHSRRLAAASANGCCFFRRWRERRCRRGAVAVPWRCDCCALGVL